MSDVEQRAREFLALGLDEYGHHNEAENVRNGVDLDEYKVDLFAIIAALSAPKQVRPDPSLCCHRFGADARVCLLCGWNFRENGDAPQPVEAEGREPSAWLVESGHYRQAFTEKASADAQVFELRKGGYEVSITPLASQQPEQPAIDLEQFRPAVEATKRYGERLHAEGAFLPEQYDDWMEKADRLLVIIDGAKAGRAEGES